MDLLARLENLLGSDLLLTLAPDGQILIPPTFSVRFFSMETSQSPPPWADPAPISNWTLPSTCSI